MEGTTSEGTKLVSGRGTNYLVIGSDARPGETASRSDVIQLVHVDEDHGDVWIIHFPRDLYVPIPGHGKNKINAAYAYGGPTLLVQTIEKAASRLRELVPEARIAVAHGQMSEALLERERAIAAEKAAASGKPADIVDAS